MKYALGRLALVVLTGLAGWLTVALPRAAVSGPDADLVAGCCWAVRILAAWVLLGLLAAVVESAAGVPDRVRRLAGRITPAVLRGVVRWAGVGSVAAVVATGVTATATAAPAHGGPGPHGPQRSGNSGAPAALRLDWPVPNRPRRPLVAPPSPRPDPLESRAPGSGGSALSGHPPAHRRPPTDRPAQPRPRSAGERPAAVVVHPGDTLWGIAARHLTGASDAVIDRGWRAWWRANRQVVGADPNLILPGERLLPPPGSTTDSAHSRRQQ